MHVYVIPIGHNGCIHKLVANWFAGCGRKGEGGGGVVKYNKCREYDERKDDDDSLLITERHIRH